LTPDIGAVANCFKKGSKNWWREEMRMPTRQLSRISWVAAPVRVVQEYKKATSKIIHFELAEGYLIGGMGADLAQVVSSPRSQN
jgi:hypothetical protein